MKTLLFSLLICVLVVPVMVASFLIFDGDSGSGPGLVFRVHLARSHLHHSDDGLGCLLA